MAIFKQPHSSYRALTWNDVTEYWDDIGQFLKKFGDRCTEFVVKAGKPIEVTILLNRKGPIGNTNILGEVVEEEAAHRRHLRRIHRRPQHASSLCVTIRTPC